MQKQFLAALLGHHKAKASLGVPLLERAVESSG
jgi:hypothetical protein